MIEGSERRPRPTPVCRASFPAPLSLHASAAAAPLGLIDVAFDAGTVAFALRVAVSAVCTFPIFSCSFWCDIVRY